MLFVFLCLFVCVLVCASVGVFACLFLVDVCFVMWPISVFAWSVLQWCVSLFYTLFVSEFWGLFVCVCLSCSVCVCVCLFFCLVVCMCVVFVLRSIILGEMLALDVLETRLLFSRCDCCDCLLVHFLFLSRFVSILLWWLSLLVYACLS